ncbi:mobilization protein, partial [Phocaeicola vulgatus]
MENERRTEYNVDMRPEEDFLSDILSASQIRATDTYETPPQIIWI